MNRSAFWVGEVSPLEPTLCYYTERAFWACFFFRFIYHCLHGGSHFGGLVDDLILVGLTIEGCRKKVGKVVYFLFIFIFILLFCSTVQGLVIIVATTRLSLFIFLNRAWGLVH